MSVSTFEVAEAGAKQVWTGENFEKQFYSKDPMLEEVLRLKPEIQIGLEALTPVQTGRGGGITWVPKTGSGALNEAAPQQTTRAKWEYKRQWGMIEMDTAAIERTKDAAKAIMRQLDLEVEGKLSDMRKQLTRTLFGDGTALIAQCAKEESESKTINLLKTGFGYQALRNGYLPVGQVIDIGSKTEEGLKAADKAILAFSESEETPTLEIATKIKTAETDYVSLANSRSGETSYENNGWGNLASETTTLGGLKPETTGSWKGIVEDAKSTPITRQKVIKLRRRVRQKGETPDWAFTSLAQIANLENESFTQVRFPDTKSQNTGDGESIMVGNLSVQGHQDCPDKDFYMAVKKHVFILRAGPPEWATEKYGGKGILMYKIGTTYVNGAIESYQEFATNRRNSIGRLTGLSV
jgi:hypothetical protein